MIALDTCVLIQGIQQADPQLPPALSAQAARTHAFLEQLLERRERILIPLPVIVEYLVPFPPETHHLRLSALRESFVVHTLDDHAASIAAALQREEAFNIAQSALREEGGVPAGVARNLVKMDALILGIAIAQHAKALITHDVKHMTHLAGDRIQVLPVPPVARQALLPNLLEQQ